MQTNAFNKGRSCLWLPPQFLLILNLIHSKIRSANSRKWIMRINITTVLLIIALAQVNAKSFGQKITLESKNTALKAVLKSIEQQTGFLFLAKDYDLSNPKINIRLENASIEEAMRECLRDLPLTYMIIDNNVILSKKDRSVLGKLLEYLKTIEIRGQIVDEKGNPLPGATVRVKGTQKVVVTNSEGLFLLAGLDEKSIIIVSYMGYKTKEIVLTGKEAPLIIAMEISPAELEGVDVVSTGYQKLPKERATGSFALVNQADLDKQIAVSSISEKFKTLLPGVLMAGSVPIIRGKTTMNANQFPIIVIDGFPTELSLAAVNPNDVESITVLRDAAAASIWGVRASNGVIVITTKKGRRSADGKPAIAFSSTVKIEDIPDIGDLKLANSTQAIDAELEALTKGWYDLTNPNRNLGYSPVYEVFVKRSKGTITEEQANQMYNVLRNNNSYGQTDLFFKKGIQQQYNLSASGAKEFNRYYISANYQSNKSYSIGNDSKRLTLFVKNSYQLFPRVNLDADVNLSYNKGTNNGVGMYEFVRQRPYELFVDQQGNYVPTYDPYRSMERIKELKDKGYYDWSYNRKRDFDNADNSYTSFIPRINLGIAYTIMDGLVFDSKFQHERSEYKYDSFQNDEIYFVRDWINQLTKPGPGNTLINQLPRGTIYNAHVDGTQASSWRNQLRFDQAFGKKHRVNALLGTEINRVVSKGKDDRYYNYDKTRLTSTVINEKQLAEGVTGWDGSVIYYPTLYKPVQETQNRYFSMYFNGSYTYDDRYIISSSARIDKSNLLGASTNDKMTPLYSVGAAWNVSREEFFKVSFIDELKLRLTTGINGNVDKSTSKVLIGIPQINSYSTGEDYLRIQFPENKNLRWESTKVTNAGIDLGLFNKRINMNLDVYRKKSYDLLGFVDADPSVGFEKVYKNTAEVKNTGFDLRFAADVFTGDFKWNSTLNLSYNKNEVVKVYNPSPSLDNYLTGGKSREVVGLPIDYFYNLKWAGLSAEGEPQAYNDKGDVVTWKNGGQPTVDWLSYAGSTLPKYYGAWINTFSYKGFQLTPIITYKFGHVMRLPTTYVRGLSPVLSDIDKRWRKPGDEANTTVPKMFETGSEPYLRRQFYAMNTSRTASASYVRLSNVSLTYDLPKQVTGKVFKNIQLQTQATDLAIWVKNKEHIDPEVAGLRSGDLNLSAPITYTFGIKADF